MPPAPPTRSRPPSRATAPTPAPAPTRMTRTRAATKETPAPTPSLPSKPSGFLAKGKEGLRKVSDKMKEKERLEKEKMEKERTERMHATAKKGSLPILSEGAAHSESLQAFLRIRPPPVEGSFTGVPYLEEQGDKEVLMRGPTDPHRPHLPAKVPVIFSFDRVFSPSTPQSTFFTDTTLPLVEKLLHGENGLMFAYGVSNSGKSYTISGGDGADVRGVLPRGIDVVFNSIKGLECQTNLRCVGLADVEIMQDEPDMRMFDHLTEGETGTSESVKVDRNYSYAVFVSYSEVYNEKIFDLLDSVLPVPSTVPPTPSGRKASTIPSGSALPRGSTAHGRGSMAWNSGLNSSMNLAALANGGSGVIRRQALALKNDPEGNGKYIAGLNEIRVRTREEALAVFRAGQRARQVFGTLANRESSRSHGIFTIKVVKVHNGAPNDPESAQVSRLAIVDLAGSERTRNTGTTGDRLKEAGNINKSLMVLGQCLEVLRANQQKLSAPGAPGARKKLALVPFRQSKLTEIFQNFFVGDGRAIMIVNVNPYDTGYDENLHVMRFSAVAREVQTTAGNKVTGGLRRQISTQFSALKQAVRPMRIKVTVPVIPHQPQQQQQAIGSGARAEPRKPMPEHRDSAESYVMVEEELEVVEEDPEDESDEEEPRDVFVDYLFEELREMKQKLYEAEMRNATIEMEVREEVAQEMQATIQKMHDDFAQRLQEQVKAGELKMDRKIDILSRVMTPAPAKSHKPLPKGQKYLASTPDIDMDTSMDASSSSMDASFESAIDESLLEGTISPLSRGSTRGRISDVTDPFFVQSGLRNQVVLNDEDDEDDDEEEESDEEAADHSMGDTSLESPLRTKKPATKKAASNVVRRIQEDDAADTSIDTIATDESGDVLGDMSVDQGSEGEVVKAIAGEEADQEEEALTDEEQSEDEGSNEDSEDEEEEDDDEDDEDDEEEESDDEDEIDEASQSDSSFAESDAASESSVEPSPVRRMSTKKSRQTVSPNTATKRRQTATPSKTKGTPPKRAKAAVGALKSPPPLSERMRQDSVVEVVESEDEVEVVKPKAKKRTLGKKIVMEDEMERGDVATPGADAKRMTPRGSVRR